MDGWALQILKKQNVGYAATMNAAGQTFGSMLSLVSFVALNKLEWATLGGVMRTWGFIFIAVTAAVAVLKKETSYPTGHASSATEIYKEMFSICKLRAFKALFLILMTSKIGFAPVDAILLLRLQAAGMPKEHLAYMGSAVALLGIAVPGYLMSYENPMALFSRSYRPRLLIGSLLVALVVAAPSPWRLSPVFYGACFGLLALGTIASSAMFVVRALHRVLKGLSTDLGSNGAL